MKTRTGFVSNSSSSSFIMGIANVGKDRGDFTFDIPREENEYNVKLPWYINTEQINEEDYKVYIESFNGSEVSTIAKIGDNIVAFDGEGPDGDSYFWKDDYYMDYYIELDEFYPDSIASYENIQKLGGEVSYGAGRNG